MSKRHYIPYEPPFLKPHYNIKEAYKYMESVINAPKVHPIAALNFVCMYCCPHYDLYPNNTYCTCPNCPIGCLHAKMKDTRRY